MPRNGSIRPAQVGSGSAAPAQYTQRFPNIPDLVHCEENEKYLEALLPALQKYKCLQYTTVKPRRSPWVRTFVDLYHPAGPWGRFSNAPDISSKQKYAFKGTKLPRIYQELQKYQGSNQAHRDLRAALHQYYEKGKYHKEYMAACEVICMREVNKPVAERARIPSTAIRNNESEPAQRAASENHATPAASSQVALAAAAAETVTDLAGIELPREEPANDSSIQVSQEEPGQTYTRESTDSANVAVELNENEPVESRKRDADNARENANRPTRRQRREGEEDESEEDQDAFFDARATTGRNDDEIQGLQNSTPPKAAANTGGSRSVVPVTPSSPRPTADDSSSVSRETSPPATASSPVATKASRETEEPTSGAAVVSEKSKIQAQRAELSELLNLRRQSRTSSGNDTISKEIEVEIDGLDEKLFRLISRPG